MPHEPIRVLHEKDTAISDSFIITASESISTQCDVIIYQSNIVPLIDNNIAKFFPVEVVSGIGEIKSNLSKSQFKDALRKIAKNKMLSNERTGEPCKNVGNLEECNYLTTFLVCNKVTFDISTIDFEEIYQDIPRVYWHNMILSLENGLITYNLCFESMPPNMKKTFIEKGGNIAAKSVIWEYPVRLEREDKCDCQIKLIKADSDNKYAHILSFLTAVKSALEFTIKYEFDLGIYLDLHSKDIFL